ncbi:MAG: type II secretion system protein [Christensenella sp.]|uniref:type IV pilus modification PilV family protein n=1 Tax=Christensenella sp. TaxID=1935934 RepID=UPI002B1F25BF|nr:type II secretion system protein [Christensenella sp.]MEA5002012.1 type II secretion system protein [Christensenella sp.]
MKKRNTKKGITLVEVIISLGLLGIVAIALLGVLAPTVNMEKNTRKMNTATFDVAGELERGLYSLRSGSDITDLNYLTYWPHTLDFTLNDTDFSIDGKLVKSQDPNGDTTLQAFAPNASGG